MDDVLDEWSTAILKLKIESECESVPIEANKKLEGLPKGISRLSRLRSLDMLVVPEHKEAYFDIGDFKRLNNLRLEGFRCVKGCRNLGNAAEAEKIGLNNIQDFHFLHLDFGQSKKNSGFEDDSAILEALEPHQNLRQLYIKNYMSPNVSPRWKLSLINLRQVVLVGCDNCEILPSLGELPFLEGFNANGMNSLKKLGVELLVMRKRDDAEEEEEEEEDGETSRDDGFKSPNAIVSSPKLKLLRFEDFPQWEKWEGTNTETGLIVMPCLKRLRDLRCPRLQALPNFLQKNTSLKRLDIQWSEILEEGCKKRTGKEWAKISHIPNIEVNFKYVQKDGIHIQGDNNVPGTSSSPYISLFF